MSSAKHYLAMGPHVWGRGESAADAIKVARKVGAGSKSSGGVPGKGFLIFECGPSTRVNDLGGLVWQTDEGEPVELGWSVKGLRFTPRAKGE